MHTKKTIWFVFGAILVLLAAYVGYRYGTAGSDTHVCEEPSEAGLDKKPVIYLYPETETEVSVQLPAQEKLTCSYPKYSDGWHVMASPDGTLRDLRTGKSLYALYYESRADRYDEGLPGFVVKGEDTAEFLEEKLALLGLTDREAEEMIIYWLPKLEASPYNYIRFLSEEEIDREMPLVITPKPDTTLRVRMVFRGLQEPVSVKEQKLITPVRHGFTVVEWGGTSLK